MLDNSATVDFNINKKIELGLRGELETISFRQQSRLNSLDLQGSRPIKFVPPSEGTPAAEALAANAAIKVSKVSKGFHKLRGLKRPKMKSLNLVKKLNKTTKTKRGRKHFSTNFKGKVIDGVHELYTLTAGMMLGIRYSIGKNHCESSKSMDVSDFNYVEKVIFPPKGHTELPHLTPMHSLAHTFKFKSYAPRVFKRLRDFFGIDAASYMISVCGDYNFIEFISNSKSGQFFFYSHDGKYMIKTQTKDENKFMKRILPHYYKFLTENPHSMLVQILGMHRVKMYHLRRKVHFVIMTSVFDSPAQINTIYDLKGSLIGRSATDKERMSGGVLKDNDLICDKRKFHLGSKKQLIVEQLEKDSMFLASLNIMDYSLLIGIHDRNGRPGIGEKLGMLTKSQNTTDFNLKGVQTHSSSTSGAVCNSTTSNGVVRSNTPFRRSIHSVTVTEINKQQKESVAVIASDDQILCVSSLSDSPSRKHAKRASFLSDIEMSSLTNMSSRIPLSDRTSSLLDFDDASMKRIKEQVGFAACNYPNSSSQYHYVVTHNTQHQTKSTNKLVIDYRRRSSSSSQEINSGVELCSASLGGSGNSILTCEDDDFCNRVFKSSADDFDNFVYEHEEGDEDDLDDCGLFDDDGDESFDEEDSFDDCIDDGDSGSENGYSHAFKQEHQKKYRVNSKISGDILAEENLLNDILRQTRICETVSQNRQVYTFGPNATNVKPWTSRKDGGINARGPLGREDEIYFIGIIDILQQYNISKRLETVYKGLTHDIHQISSVDPITYAKRFVKFIDENMD